MPGSLNYWSSYFSLALCRLQSPLNAGTFLTRDFGFPISNLPQSPRPFSCHAYGMHTVHTVSHLPRFCLLNYCFPLVIASSNLAVMRLLIAQLWNSMCKDLVKVFFHPCLQMWPYIPSPDMNDGQNRCMHMVHRQICRQYIHTHESK